MTPAVTLSNDTVAGHARPAALRSMPAVAGFGALLEAAQNIGNNDEVPAAVATTSDTEPSVDDGAHPGVQAVPLFISARMPAQWAELAVPGTAAAQQPAFEDAQSTDAPTGIDDGMVDNEGGTAATDDRNGQPTGPTALVLPMPLIQRDALLESSPSARPDGELRGDAAAGSAAVDIASGLLPMNVAREGDSGTVRPEPAAQSDVEPASPQTTAHPPHMLRDPLQDALAQFGPAVAGQDRSSATAPTDQPADQPAVQRTVVAERLLDLSRGDAWVSDIAGDLTKLKSTTDILHFRLHPASLGALGVSLWQEDGQTHLVVKADSIAAQRLLTDSRSLILETATSNGLEFDQVRIELASPDEGRPDDRQPSRRPGERAEAYPRDELTTAPEIPSTQTTRAARAGGAGYRFA